MPEIIYVSDDETDLQSPSMGACAVKPTSKLDDWNAEIAEKVEQMKRILKRDALERRAKEEISRRQQQATQIMAQDDMDFFDPYGCS